MNLCAFPSECLILKIHNKYLTLLSMSFIMVYLDVQHISGDLRDLLKKIFLQIRV